MPPSRKRCVTLNLFKPMLVQQPATNQLATAGRQSLEDVEQVEILSLLWWRRFGRIRFGRITASAALPAHRLLHLHPVKQYRAPCCFVDPGFPAEWGQCPDAAPAVIQQTFPHQILTCPLHLVVKAQSAGF